MFLSWLECSACGKRHDWQRLQNLCTVCGKTLFAIFDLAADRKRLTWNPLQNLCTVCGKPLFAIVDLEAVRKLDGFKPSSLQRRERSLWRWRELLSRSG